MNLLLDLLYPKACLECKLPGVYICKKCLSDVRIPFSTCPVCQRFSIEGKTHPKCKTKYSLDSHVALWNYEGVIRKSIIALKYKFASSLVHEIAQCSTLTINNRYEYLKQINCTLVSIPASRMRYNWRGFNQAYEIGKLISEKTGWKFLPDLLIKRNTKTQTGLKKEERLKNLKGAFYVSSKGNLSKDSPILLFDDVWTTGSTMNEVANVLKKAGFTRVEGLTIAKTGTRGSRRRWWDSNPRDPCGSRFSKPLPSATRRHLRIDNYIK